MKIKTLHQIGSALLCTVICGCASGTDSPTPVPNLVDGGSGEAHPYIIRADNSDERFDSSKDYFAISAMSWFVNQQGNWIRSEQASATVQITANATLFNFPIGNFALTKGAKTAPIFGFPLLPTTPFDGSPITIQAALIGMKKNTVLGEVLQELATDAMSYGTTALGTLSLGTAYPGLSQVTSAANNMAATLTKEMGQNTVSIFDTASGISLTLGTADLKGNTFYVLLYKGRSLKAADLTLAPDNLTVLENGNRLSDGAWILFKIAKEQVYEGARPWTAPGRLVVSQLKLQMEQYKNDPTTGADLLKSLANSPQGTGKLLGDQFVFAINLIQSDKALSNDQALKEETSLSTYHDLAKKAIAESKAQIFFDGVALLEGKIPATSEVAKTVQSSITTRGALLKQAGGDKFANILIGDQFASQVVGLQQVKENKKQQREMVLRGALQNRRGHATTSSTP